MANRFRHTKARYAMMWNEAHILSSAHRIFSTLFACHGTFDICRIYQYLRGHRQNMYISPTLMMHLQKKSMHMSRGLWLWLCAVCKATTLYFYTIKTDSFGLHANFCCTPFAPGNTKQKKCCNTWNGICRTSIAEIAALKNGGKNRGKKVENVFECVR